jgi:hypothetical protein
MKEQTVKAKRGRPPKATKTKTLKADVGEDGPVQEQLKEKKLDKVLTDEDFDSRELYRVYKIVIQLRDQLRGGIPKNPELIRSWIVASTGHNDELTEEQVQQVEQLVETAAEKSWCGFMGDGNGLFLPSRNIKAMMKECAQVLGFFGNKNRGSKNVFQHAFEIKPVDNYRSDRIYLMKMPPDEEDEGGVSDATRWGDPDGTDEKPIHVVTRQGPRTALKRTDYVTKPILQFEIWVLATHPAETRHISTQAFIEMFKLAKENGLGAERSQGHGKFDILSFQQIQ